MKVPARLLTAAYGVIGLQAGMLCGLLLWWVVIQQHSTEWPWPYSVQNKWLVSCFPLWVLARWVPLVHGTEGLTPLQVLGDIGLGVFPYPVYGGLLGLAWRRKRTALYLAIALESIHVVLIIAARKSIHTW